MVLTSVGSSSEWGLLCIIGCRGRWEATCWSPPSSFSLEVKSWVIVSSPSAAQANGEVACLEDILLQKKEIAWIQNAITDKRTNHPLHLTKSEKKKHKNVHFLTSHCLWAVYELTHFEKELSLPVLLSLSTFKSENLFKVIAIHFLP